MDSKTKKRRIVLNLYDTDLKCKVYYGRLLGIVDDQEFAAMVGNSELQKKCMTKETKSLSDITDYWCDLTGYRIVVAIRKADGKDVNKRLLVTKRLALVSFVCQEELESTLEVGITTADDAYILLQEEEEQHA